MVFLLKLLFERFKLEGGHPNLIIDEWFQRLTHGQKQGMFALADHDFTKKQTQLWSERRKR